jgi:tetratricopeptide (TPR) repeat protein
MLLGPDFFLSHHIYVANGQRKIYFTYNGGPVFDLRVNPGAQTTEANAPDSPDPHGESEPTSALGYSQRGEAFASRRDYARAIADLSRARDMEPQNALYAYQRGLAYRENAQPFLAMAEFEAALKLKPDYVDALLARAQLRFAGRDAAAARADLATVDKIVPTQSDARLALAALYSRSGDHAAAVPQYDQWIRAHPDDGRLAVALNGRCWAGAQLGADLDRALAACDSALRREPKNASFLDSRGLVHLRRGETDKAMEDYNAALAINPRIAWALYGRALAEQRKGQGDAAKADFAAASAISPVVAREAKERGIVS